MRAKKISHQALAGFSCLFAFRFPFSCIFLGEQWQVLFVRLLLGKMGVGGGIISFK